MFPHAGRYGSDNFVTPDGVPVPAGTEVVVYEANGTTLATIYADKDRGVKANPFVLADVGNVTFHAEPGEYRIEIDGSSIPVVISPWPDDFADFALLAGGNTFTGLQELDLSDLPILDADAIMAGAEFTIIAQTTSASGIMTGLSAARLDLTGFGSPLTDVASVAAFWIYPTSGTILSELIVPGEPTRTARAVIPNFQIINFFTPPEPGTTEHIFVTGTPINDNDAANKKYVDDSVAGGGETSNGLRLATKYGRDLGGKWALVCSPGFYRTPDVGPLDRGGIRFRGRGCIFEPDFTRSGESINFYEMLTQFRNANGYSFDQDNLEIAPYLQQSVVGLFVEDCLIETPFPVSGGEYNDGRIYSEREASSGLDLGLGDAFEIMFNYIYDRGDGRFTKAFYIRTDEAGFDPVTDLYEARRPLSWSPQQQYGSENPGGDSFAEDIYWKQVAFLVGPEGQVGSIADAGLPFYIGRNGGTMGVEYVQLEHLNDPTNNIWDTELILDFQSKDIDPLTGIGTSLLVPGQIFEGWYGDEETGGVQIPLPIHDNSFLEPEQQTVERPDIYAYSMWSCLQRTPQQRGTPSVVLGTSWTQVGLIIPEHDVDVYGIKLYGVDGGDTGAQLRYGILNITANRALGDVLVDGLLTFPATLDYMTSFWNIPLVGGRAYAVCFQFDADNPILARNDALPGIDYGQDNAIPLMSLGSVGTTFGTWPAYVGGISEALPYVQFLLND